MASSSPQPPKFRVVIVVFAWTEASAAQLKKQAEGMFAGASVMIEPNAPKPATVLADDHDSALKMIEDLEGQIAVHEATLGQLQKENDRLNIKADDLAAASIAAQAQSLEKAAAVAAAPVKINDILEDRHTGKFVVVRDVTETDFAIYDVHTRDFLWRVKFESAGEFIPRTANDVAKDFQKNEEAEASAQTEEPAAIASTPPTAAAEPVAEPASPAASTRAKTGATGATAPKRIRAKAPAAKRAPKKTAAPKRAHKKTAAK